MSNEKQSPYIALCHRFYDEYYNPADKTYLFDDLSREDKGMLCSQYIKELKAHERFEFLSDTRMSDLILDNCLDLLDNVDHPVYRRQLCDTITESAFKYCEAFIQHDFDGVLHINLTVEEYNNSSDEAYEKARGELI